ncbi:MAG: AarF/ABC1/UbiB kinase family protein [bacterium]
MATLGMPRRLRSVGRFRRIMVVLAKYGFGEVLSRANIGFPMRAFLRKPGGSKVAGPERLRLAIEELGPTFIKFGQILSTRSYLLPPDYGAELAKLQDSVSPFTYEEAEAIVRADLGGGPDEIFAGFERQPFASASIAQVHLATLKTGERVCVKVQRPAVKDTFLLDIMILKDLAALLEAHVVEARQYDPVGAVREFERSSRREIDFGLEATNIAVFARNFADDPTIKIPAVFRQYSGSRILTTELIEGIKISEVDKLRQAGHDLPGLARAGARAVLKQVFEYGFFHADPHPGNLFVTEDGRIGVVDFGIVGRLTRQEIGDLAEVLIGIVEGSGESLAAVLEKLHMIPEDVERRDVVEELMLLSEKYAAKTLGELNMKEVFGELVSFMRRYRIRMRTEFLLLGKALSIYEEVGRLLDPSFSMMEEAKPYVRRLVRRRHLLSAVLGGHGRGIGDTISKLSAIPSDLAYILHQAREGKLKIEFEHVGLEGVTSEIEKASNRLAFSLLVAALVVASSLVLVLGRGELVWRLFGIAGFGFAALVGIWLLINILRSGRV